jgi:hypothetical protein
VPNPSGTRTGGRAIRTPLLAFHEAFGLLPTDEVHGFLDLLDRLARMDE